MIVVNLVVQSVVGRVVEEAERKGRSGAEINGSILSCGTFGGSPVQSGRIVSALASIVLYGTRHSQD